MVSITLVTTKISFKLWRILNWDLNLKHGPANRSLEIQLCHCLWLCLCKKCVRSISQAYLSIPDISMYESCCHAYTSRCKKCWVNTTSAFVISWHPAAPPRSLGDIFPFDLSAWAQINQYFYEFALFLKSSLFQRKRQTISLKIIIIVILHCSRAATIANSLLTYSRNCMLEQGNWPKLDAKLDQ